MSHFVIILAAGKGSRLNNGKIPKQFLELSNLPVVMHSVIAFNKADPQAKIYVALPTKYIQAWTEICKKYDFSIKHEIYAGGERRLDTVFIGLKKIYQLSSFPKQDLVSIHDSARPFIKPEFVLELINCAKKSGSAVPVIKLKNSLRNIGTGQPYSSCGQDRDDYVITQTPQVFSLDGIVESYRQVLFSKSEDYNHLVSPCIDQPKKIFDDGLKDILVTSDYFLGKYITKNLTDISSNEVFLKSGSEIIRSTSLFTLT